MFAKTDDQSGMERVSSLEESVKRIFKCPPASNEKSTRSARVRGVKRILESVLFLSETFTCLRINRCTIEQNRQGSVEKGDIVEERS